MCAKKGIKIKGKDICMYEKKKLALNLSRLQSVNTRNVNNL